MRTRRGASLVLTLFVVASLMAVIAVVVNLQRTSTLARTNRMEARAARQAAESAIEYGLAVLALQGQSFATTLLDDWANLGGQGDDLFVLGRQSFRFEIVDASGFININTATEDQLRRLPMTNEQIDSLLDWREPDLFPRPEGAKDPFYNNLYYGYNAKLGPFDSVEELLLVRGFTPDALYYPQTDIVLADPLVQGTSDTQPALIDIFTVRSSAPNQTPLGETKLNVNNASIIAMVGRGIPFPLATRVFAQRQLMGTVTSLGALFREAGITVGEAELLVDNLTANPAPNITGLINVNTASEAVLNSVPGMTADVTNSILARQEAGGFLGLGELVTLPGFTDQTLWDAIDYFGVHTNVFIIRAEGRTGRSRVRLEAVVEFRDGRPLVVQMREPSDIDIVYRWNWSNAPTREITLSEGF